MCEISVVIPAFNAENYIKQSVDSVLNQTIEVCEIIIVDDGSSDRTVEVVTSFNNKKISLITQRNQGSGCARNNGVKLSKGKWIAFLDADDEWMDNHLEALLKATLQNEHAVMAYSGKIWIDKYGLIIPSHPIQNEYPSGWIFNKLLENNYISSSSCVIALRRVLIQSCGFRTESVFRNSQDYELWLRISSNYQVVSSGIESVRYRRHENNQTLKKAKYATGYLASILSGCSLVTESKVHPMNNPGDINTKEILRRVYLDSIRTTFYYRDYPSSKDIFYKSLNGKIFDYRIIIRGLLSYAPGSFVDALRIFARRLLMYIRN